MNVAVFAGARSYAEIDAAKEMRFSDSRLGFWGVVNVKVWSTLRRNGRYFSNHDYRSPYVEIPNATSVYRGKLVYLSVRKRIASMA